MMDLKPPIWVVGEWKTIKISLQDIQYQPEKALSQEPIFLLCNGPSQE
jgi:hypothetical protein